MKLISYILFTLFLSKGCVNQPKQDFSKSTVTYTAETRGYFMQITIEDKELRISKDRETRLPSARIPLTAADQKKVLAMVKAIDVPNLSQLKAPTEKRFYDGAAIGNLSVTHNGETFGTAGFDHGNPPVEIEQLVAFMNAFDKSE
ncbi:MAG: hypothetical protein KA325_00190 [Flavobacterium sp.]|nr:hypothetical protein [Flavobacterium sp.]